MTASSLLLLSIIVTGLLIQSNCEECPSLSKSCRNCIIMPGCAWCKNETYIGSRCDTVDKLKEYGCDSFENPKTIFETPKNEDLTDGTYLNEEDEEPINPAIQIQPQEIRLKLRQGESQRFTVKVRQALNYPLDVYYLMDLSKSMGDDLTNLKNLAATIGEEMKEITRRAKLGFGSFVDKPILPYINITSSVINEPCPGCEKAYSFRNVLALDNDVTQFSARINEVGISGNLDTAEGTFDAIMQAVVCTDQIGWRQKARKLLLLTTDASSHIQGDGRTAGVLTPNDGECRLDQNGEYHQSHLYDYPSVAFLNKKLVENNIIPIFAISGKSLDEYKKLSVLMQGARTAPLATNSRNVVRLLIRIYNDITSNVEIAHNAPQNLQLEITANCGENVAGDNMLFCSGISLGHEVTFDVDITATGCMDGATNQNFTIYPVGIDEQLTVFVDIYCDCMCEDIREANSTLCTEGNGTLSCGTCDCNKGRYGDYCECDGSNLDAISDTSSCKPDNTTSVICSGRGECICGGCVCQNKDDEEDISGDYCECSNKNCPIYNGEVCGGRERGECFCQGGRTTKCRCMSGYSGQSCSCVSSRVSCIAPQTGLICNAKGTCKCGMCSCSSKYWWGPYCDQCFTEGCMECEIHIDCIKCQVFEVGLTEEQCNMCAQIIKTVEELPDSNGTSFRECSFADENKCTVLFSYSTTELNNTIVIYVNPEPKCSSIEKTKFPILPVIIGISLGIVLLGMIIVIAVRCYTLYLDRKEYEQLLEAQKNANWQKSDNPLYQKGTQTFKNPMYGKAANN